MFNISVIIPVYNMEKHLRCCIDSILAQTFTDFEVLLIDDGSKDSSAAICDEYADKDSRVRVFHKENGGVSSARNLGLDNARGEWIIMMDADDYWIEDSILKRLISIATQNNLDVIRAEYLSVDEAGSLVSVKDYSYKKACEGKVLGAGDFVEKIICGEFFFVLNLVRRTLIGNIRYDTSMIFLEDAHFFFRLLLKAKRCMYIPDVFYAYRKTGTSASCQTNVPKLENSFKLCDFCWDIKDKTDDEILADFFRRYSVMMYYWTLQTLAANPYYKRRKEIIKDLMLETLQSRIKKRMSEVAIPLKYLLFIKTNPLIGVVLLRIKDAITTRIFMVRKTFHK